MWEAIAKIVTSFNDRDRPTHAVIAIAILVLPLVLLAMGRMLR